MTKPALFRVGRATLVSLGGLALLPAVVFAQGTPEQQRACAPDAIKLCSATIPDVPKTTACMRSHLGELSPACRTVFLDATGGAPAKREAKAKGEPTKADPAREAKIRDAKMSRGDRRMAAAPHDAAPDHPPRHGKMVGEPAPHTRVATRMEAPERREALPSAPVDAAPPREAAPMVSLAPGATIPGVAAVQENILQSCRDGLIDAFTCHNTLRVFGLEER